MAHAAWRLDAASSGVGRQAAAMAPSARLQQPGAAPQPAVRRLDAAPATCSPRCGASSGRGSRRHLCIASSSAQEAPALRVDPSACTAGLTTLGDCQLAVSVYPRFAYDARGGGGTGSVARDAGSGRLLLDFPAEGLQIPPLNWRTTKLFGVPLPPPLQIAIVPKQLRGYVDPATGEAGLDFDAEFRFTAGALYQAPPLAVVTTLTSEASSGEIRSARGRRVDASGSCTLVGVARVPRTGDWFLDAFLMLPTDALAVLSAEVTFS